MRERVRALRLCRRAMQTSEQKFRGPEAERRIHNEASSINLGDLSVGLSESIDSIILARAAQTR